MVKLSDNWLRGTVPSTLVQHQHQHHQQRRELLGSSHQVQLGDQLMSLMQEAYQGLAEAFVEAFWAANDHVQRPEHDDLQALIGRILFFPRQQDMTELAHRLRQAQGVLRGLSRQRSLPTPVRPRRMKKISRLGRMTNRNLQNVAVRRDQRRAGVNPPTNAVAMSTAPLPQGISKQTRYKPGSSEARALFTEAAKRAGLPPSWGSSSALHNILRRESNGVVGKPNYTYRGKAPGTVHAELKRGHKSAKSSATGLGQLLLANVDKYYPSGRRGIGDPIEEAAGMLRYIKDRYGSPERAWQLYGKLHEGY